MDFGEEITQLLLIIVVLGVAYLGITAWVKRGGGFGRNASGGGSGGVNFGSASEDLNAEADDDLSEMVGKRDRHPTRSDGQRFDLKGKDAEAAAKVLKRMLKQDQKLKEK